MGVLRYKIWRDLWANRARTLQVVLIISIGTFAIGLIIATRNLVARRLTETWQASSPAMIALWTNPPVDDQTISALERIKGLVAVEGYASTTIEWRLSTDERWQPANLIARADYSDQHYNQLTLVSGNWPQGKPFAVWQGSEVAFGLAAIGQVQIRVNDQEYTVPITGIIADAANQPSGIGSQAQFYTTRNRFDELVGTRNFNRLMAGAAAYDETTLTHIADQMQRKLEKLGVASGGAVPSEGPSAGNRVTDPERHFAQDIADGVFFVLGLLAVLALVLGLLLVYNTMNAIISQQVDQIGMMKAIGASTGQIVRLYLTTVLGYGLLSLLIAMPLGVLGSWALSSLILQDFNITPGPFTLSLPALEVQMAIALLAPLLASLLPIFSGARVTVREAISTYGLSTGTGLLERFLTRFKQISSLLLLIISYTFRHKKRVILTQFTLVLSGLIFMMVMSVWDATRYTFEDVVFSILQFNINFQLQEPERISQVEALTLSHPEVATVEMWAVQNGAIRLYGQPETEDDPDVLLFGLSLPTTLYAPQIRAGRWLMPEDTQAMVLNEIVAEKAGVDVGDWITVDHGVAGETTWQVVGLLFDPVTLNSAHVPREPLLRKAGRVNKASTIWIQTTRQDTMGEKITAASLRRFYEENQLELTPQGPFGADTASEITTQIFNQFGVLIALLAAMAIVMGIVGSIALGGVLSLNVLERRREIGIMRAIGAQSVIIARLLIGEGLILGWLSWLIALPLSLPAGQLMTQALGQAINIGLIHHYTPQGAFYWLVIITLLSVAASWFPARGAMRVSVRESLAY